MVTMVGDEDDEVDFVWPKDTCGYRVKPEFMPVLRKIIGKHGNIVKNCPALTVKYRSMLERICEIISELEKKDGTKIREGTLRCKIGVVNEIKNMEVEVEWFHTRLAEILEARTKFQQFGMKKDKTDNNRKTIEIAKSA
uniref:Uncharacterized protein LOC101492226 n=1 Tax=Cicer arietinum TaxID=3827 RepID=A0A1S3E7S5_CICAR|nr:uncharacterized protein LOC101492226 [Cicer arietinum]